MSRGLQDGIYSLRLAKDPSPLVGVNLRGVSSQPVVTDGVFRTWVVSKQADGNYTLALQDVEGNSFAQGDDGGVVAVRGAVATWTVDGPEGGPYTIQGPGDLIPPTAWTVDTPSEPGSPIVLKALQLQPQIPENQKWYFVAPQ